MTEDEAKKKTCCGPMGVLESRAGASSYASRVCIASACMAWRWGGNIPLGAIPNPRLDRPAQGFCGLAGGGQ